MTNQTAVLWAHHPQDEGYLGQGWCRTLPPGANQERSWSYNSHKMTFCSSSSLIDADERGITVKL